MLPAVPRVFVLGSSNISKYLTYHLASHPSQPPVPDVVLILKSEEESKTFVDFNRSSITVKDYSQKFGAIFRKQIMATSGAPKFSDGKVLKLPNLVLSESSVPVDMLLKFYQRSIDQNTNILLLDGNRSAVENLYKNVFKNPNKRPNIYQCIHTHRLFGTENFTVNSLGTGSLTIAKIPRDLDHPTNSELTSKIDLDIEKQPDFIRMLLDTTSVHPVFVSFKDFELLQLESLIVRAAIEPLTVVFDCVNGELLHIENITYILTKIVNESVKVLSAAYPHILQNPYSHVALNTDRLVDVILNVLRTSYGDMSRVKFDISVFKKHLDQNSNTYLANLAKTKSLSAPLNSMYSELIKGRHSLELFRSDLGYGKWKPKL